MAVLCRWILVLTMLLAAGPRLCGGDGGGPRLRGGSQGISRIPFYDRAEAGFAAFCQKFPNSPRLAEAILLQAEARVQLSNYAGAIELLVRPPEDAGTNADQYLFWLGEANLRQGDYRAASDGFARLVKEFPASSRRWRRRWARRPRGRRSRDQSLPNGRA